MDFSGVIFFLILFLFTLLLVSKNDEWLKLINFLKQQNFKRRL